ncbi:MAG: DUF349 domain-containing protein [Planctomycetota bacterium]|nr:MAG: DUF349 domain-containing protein [Planctomycetota bacterium]
MGFFGGRKKGIQAAAAEERLSALQRLPNGEQKVFAQLVQNDPDSRVRLAAARRVKDAAVLQRLLQHPDGEIQAVAREGLAADAGRRLRSCDLSAGKVLIEMVAEGQLGDLALQAKDAGVRDLAVQRLFALEAPPQQALLSIAIGHGDDAIALRALAMIGARSQLKQVAKKAKSAALRAAAEARIAAQREEQERPSPHQMRTRRRQQWGGWVEEAAILALRSQWDQVGAQLAAIEGKVMALRDNPEYPPLEAEDEALLTRFKRSYALFTQRREEAAGALASCQAILAEHPDPEDSALRECFEQALAAVVDEQQQEALRAAYPRRQQKPAAAAESDEAEAAPVAAAAPVIWSEADEAALAAIEARAQELVAAEDLRATADAFQSLHKEWMNAVAGLPAQHPRRQPFLEAWSQFKDRRRGEREQRDQAIEQRVSQLEALVAEMAALVERAPAEGAAVAKALRDLRQRWRDIAPVPGRLGAPLKAAFNQQAAAVEQALASWYQERDWQRFAQVAPAEELCAAAEALANPEQPLAGADLLAAVKDLQNRWRALGPLPQGRNDELWDRFRTACDAAFERLQPWFAERDQERERNAEAREALIQRLSMVVEDIATVGLVGSPASRDHEQRRQEQVAELQAAWKECGHVKREQRAEMDQRWKQLLDRFYGHRRSQRAQQEAEFAENVPLKEAIIESLQAMVRDAEAAHAGMLPGRTLDEVLERLRQARRDWREIGFVPKNQVARLRASWDELNDRLQELLADRLQNEHEQEAAAATAKQVIIGEMQQLLEEERPDWFRDEVGALRRRWSDAGRVPRALFKQLEDDWRRLNDEFEARARAAMS